jgi:hypothetical protein
MGWSVTKMLPGAISDPDRLEDAFKACGTAARVLGLARFSAVMPGACS